MAIKKSVWDIILKVIIAAVSALAGAIGVHATNVL
nr:smalltalk protein [uncultured Bacteroides sp.]